MTNIEPKSQSPLKYLIKEVLKENLDRDITQEKFIEYIGLNGIKKATFYSDVAITLENEKSIPEIRLQIYAKALAVNMEDLLNYQVNQRAVNELHKDENRIKRREKVAASFNLSK